MNNSGDSMHNSPMAAAAFVLSIIAVVSLLFIYAAVPLGALAITLALLSRGRSRLFGKAKTAVTIALAAIIGSCFITGYSFYRVWTDPILKDRFSRFLDYYITYYSGTDNTENEYINPGSKAPVQIHGGNFT